MILIAGVGYSHLTDLSFGPQLVEDLRTLEWPENVLIEDLSYGPIAVLQWFQDQPKRFSRAIFAGAMQRERGVPGELRAYRWKSGGISADEVQERVAEAVTGIVSLENLLIITDHFNVLPPDTLVIELEPVVVEFGLELSPMGDRRLAETRMAIEREVSRALPTSTPVAGHLRVPAQKESTGLNGGGRGI